MIKSTRIVYVVLLTIVAFVISASFEGARAEEKLKLTIATGIGPTVPTSWWFASFIGPKLKEYSKGRIDVNVQISGSLCSEDKCVQQAKLGQIDIGSVSAGNIGAFGKTFDILNLPYIFKDDKSADKLINGWLGKDLSDEATKEMGLHIIAIIPSYSFRNVDNCRHEIRVPADMKGIKFRVTKTAVEFNLIKTWGGIPVPYDWNQLYEGLQSGIVQGMYIPDAYVAAKKFYEVCKFITETGGGWNSHIIFMAENRY
ncbi:MAG: TRAP transporter substrate-binding protein, partial [Candidatus Saccharimonadales bacterium]